MSLIASSIKGLIVSAIGWTGLIIIVDSAEGQPVKSVPPISRIAETPCRGVKIPLSFLGLPFGDRIGHPNPCSFSVLEPVILSLNYFDGPSGEFRFIFYSDPRQSPERIVIFLAGGPRSNVVPKDIEQGSAPELQLVLRHKAIVFVPEYLGTVQRSFYPKEDVSLAVSEISALIGRVKDAYPGLPITLVGHSAGSIVATEVLNQESLTTILLSPLLISLEDLHKYPERRDFLGDPQKASTRFFVINEATGKRDLISTPLMQQVKAWAVPTYNRDLATRIISLPTSRQRCISVITGAQDGRIGLEALPTFRRKLPNVPITIVPALNHNAETIEQAADLADRIASSNNGRCRSKAAAD